MAKRRSLPTGAGFIARHGLDPTFGEYSRTSKLTEPQALAILGKKGVEKVDAVAAEFGVSPVTVYDIWGRRSWRHLKVCTSA